MAADTTEVAVDRLRRSWGPRIVLVLIAMVAVPIGVTIVYAFPPAEYDFYPRCLLHSVTGLHCPGCGATRCVGALVHGDIAQAFAYNPLLVLALPGFAYLAGRTAFERWTGRALRTYRTPGWAIKVLIAVIILYAIARNIDMYPLNLLAPHQI